jgi:predicted anti-sigma-YlaC factor YlaD
VLATAMMTSLGCSVRSLAINALADSLAASGDAFASDEDPELVAAAIPFALKTTESLLAERPDHPALLLAACRGFTQYAFAFVEANAERLEEVDFEQAEYEFERALALYLRGRDYCLRSLELARPGTIERLRLSPQAALDEFREPQVALLFWTGAAWGGAIGIGQDRAELVADVPAVKALMERALALDEGYDHGAIHGVLIALEALPEAMGGSPERARHHFERAVELSRGLSASPYVTLAETVAVAEQDGREFERLLQAALAIDPDLEPPLRLANILAQRKARWLLERTDRYFLDYEAEPE